MDDLKNAKDKPRIGITLGDINGIGPEVVIKALSHKSVIKTFVPIIYGATRILSYYKKMLNISDFDYTKILMPDYARDKRINVINCWEGMTDINVGQGTPESGNCAYLALERSTQDLKKGRLDALVTAPIGKSNIQNDNFRFPGHTEYLTTKMEAKDSLMLMVAEDIRIGVVSGHISLSAVSQSITKDLIKGKINLFIETLKRDFRINKPKLALLGVNPHAGDNGLFGNEELTIISPAIEEARNAGHLVYGPFSADGFFGTMQLKKFDGVLAMYHDQGLIPFKVLAFGQGVNYTAGLPGVRTSPDHGTAFNIAGKGEAESTSMREAIYLARDIVRIRGEEQEPQPNKE